MIRVSLLVVMLVARGLASQEPGPGRPRTARATRLTSLEAIRLDGRLDESAWTRAVPVTRFTQVEPVEGKPATQSTEVRFMFDHRALYVGARMVDSSGARGVRSRLVRRDQLFNGQGAYISDQDLLAIAVDGYRDRRNYAVLVTNPAGVRTDGISTNGGFPDPSWDPAWEVATSTDSRGWTAEMRIPLSELRFGSDSAPLLGLQIERLVPRLGEWDRWAFWTKREAGGPARFGVLEGIDAVGVHHLDAVPYVLAGVRSAPAARPGEPRLTGTTTQAGVDFKYVASPATVLDATVRPDFGQVEVDPAVINLTAFETFFPERRPFFVEGRSVFDFGGLSCQFCNDVPALSVFYSRRIGRALQPLPNETLVDPRASADILAAIKVTHRVPRGGSVALLDAVTGAADEQVVAGEFDAQPVRRTVEPFTNYLVARGRREWRGGDVTVGGTMTSVWRDLATPELTAALVRRADVAGLDWSASWGRREYSFSGSLAGSYLVGNAPAITRLERSSARYFQRPDRRSTFGVLGGSYDTTARWLGGGGLNARLGKDAGAWLWEFLYADRTPGFESNDVGFQTHADFRLGIANLSRQWTLPNRVTRYLSLLAGGQEQRNYDGDLTEHELHSTVVAQLANYWNVFALYIHHPPSLSDRLTRGGPVVGRKGYHYVSTTASTDARRPVVVTAFGAAGWHFAGDGYAERQFSLGVTAKPTSNLSLGATPMYHRTTESQQYVAAISDPANTSFYGERYVFAVARQTELSAQLRVALTLTRALSLDVFAQPFLAGAGYEALGEFRRPRTLDRLIYGSEETRLVPVYDTSRQVTAYRVFPDPARPLYSFVVDRPDFTERSLRGNAVLRWEYRPGSTVFLVWTQRRQEVDADGDVLLERDARRLAHVQPENVLQLKVSFRYGR